MARDDNKFYMYDTINALKAHDLDEHRLMTANMAKRRPLRGSHPPGTFWYYNNWDFNVLGTIFEKATEKSLVLMDEMGAGTDPAEGAALGRAILDEIDSIGCLAIVTTHIGDLKTYAFSNPQGVG